MTEDTSDIVRPSSIKIRESMIARSFDARRKYSVPDGPSSSSLQWASVLRQATIPSAKALLSPITSGIRIEIRSIACSIRFPMAADEVHLVFERAVRADAAAAGFVGQLGDEGPAVRSFTVAQRPSLRSCEPPGSQTREKSAKLRNMKDALHRQIKATFPQVERRVSGFYGLTGAEIRIVEEATA
jgi:hypothetical protein